MKRAILLVCIFGLLSFTMVIAWAQGAKSRYKVVEVSNGGSIVGYVKFVGDIPQVEPLKISKDQHICGSAKTSEAYIVSPETKGLKNVVIRISNIRRGKKLEYTTKDKKTLTLDSNIELHQEGCVYIPHVQAAFLGTQADIINDDEVLHNVHSYSKGRRPYFRWNPKSTLFNFAQPLKGQKVPVELNTKGVIGIKCDVHPWMESYVYVADHPYFDITGADGQYRITNIPPGEYRLEAWHERLSTLKKTGIVVKAGEETKVDFKLKPVEE